MDQEEEENNYLTGHDRISIFNKTMNDVFENDRNRLEELVKEMAKTNTKRHGKIGINCFIYKGGSFYNEGERPALPLKEEYQEDMRMLANQLNNTRQAERSIKFYIRKLITSSKTNKDILFLCPDWLKQYVHTNNDDEEDLENEELTLNDVFKEEFNKLNEFHIKLIKGYIFARGLFFNNK